MAGPPKSQVKTRLPSAPVLSEPKRLSKVSNLAPWAVRVSTIGSPAPPK